MFLPLSKSKIFCDVNLLFLAPNAACLLGWAVSWKTRKHGHKGAWGKLASYFPQVKAMPKKCSNYHTIELISHSTKAMLKILQARLQQYFNQELPDVWAGFRKGRGTRDQIPNIRLIIEKARQFQKNYYFCFIDYTKVFDCVDHNKPWKILKEMGISDHLTCLLRNLYAGQEATVRTGHEVRDWFQIGKGVCQGCILSPCLFNLYAEYIMWNARLDEAQAGIKITGKISITSDMQMTPPLWQKVKRN